MIENNCKKICKKIVNSLSGLAISETCSVLAFIMLVGLLAFSSILAIGYKKQLDSKKTELFKVQRQVAVIASECTNHMFDLNTARWKVEHLEKSCKTLHIDDVEFNAFKEKYRFLQMQCEFLSNDVVRLKRDNAFLNDRVMFFLKNKDFWMENP